MAVAKERILDVLADFVAIYTRFHALERVPRDMGTGDLLYPAEIHTIDYVAKNPGCRPGEVARELAVTRGAVSQMIGRLSAKGLLVRTTSSQEPQAARLRLTAQGERAVAGHRELHRSLDERFVRYVGPLSAAECARLKAVTRRIIAELDAELGRGPTRRIASP